MQNAMSWIAFIMLFFVGARLAVSAFNYFSRPHLRPLSRPLSARVSVLIPARNEERRIGTLLDDLFDMEDDLHEIVVYDDQSSDATARIVSCLSTRHRKLRLLRGGALPPGWLGKNHACYRLARQAQGDILLFLDADVRLRNRAVIRAAAHMRDTQTTLLSLFPRQSTPTMGSEISVPLMDWILLSLLPLAAVRRSPRASLSAANGQFMAFDAKRYHEMEPHSLFRASAVEDMAIVRAWKRKGWHAATLLGRSDVECRMYETLQEAIAGFSKNIFQFFGGSEVLCYAYAFLTTAAPVAAFFLGRPLVGVFCVVMGLLIRIFVCLACGRSVLRGLVCIVPQQIVMWLILFSASKCRRQRTLLWKGRDIYRSV